MAPDVNSGTGVSHLTRACALGPRRPHGGSATTRSRAPRKTAPRASSLLRGGLSELNRLAEPRHRAAVISAFFVAAYIGPGLPAVLTGLIFLQVGPVDASGYVSGLATVAVVVAFFVVLRTFGVASAPTPPCTASDSWCSIGMSDVPTR